MKDTFSLRGRAALVTGASSGLGARFAQVLAAAGAKVVIGARRVERLDGLRTAIEAGGGQALATALDVTDEASIVGAFDAAEAQWGAVDTIVANAGVSWTGRTTDMSVADLDELVGVNVRGVFLTAREGARRMRPAAETTGADASC